MFQRFRDMPTKHQNPRHCTLLTDIPKNIPNPQIEPVPPLPPNRITSGQSPISSHSDRSFEKSDKHDRARTPNHQETALPKPPNAMESRQEQTKKQRRQGYYGPAHTTSNGVIPSPDWFVGAGERVGEDMRSKNQSEQLPGSDSRDHERPRGDIVRPSASLNHRNGMVKSSSRAGQMPYHGPTTKRSLGVYPSQTATSPVATRQRSPFQERESSNAPTIPTPVGPKLEKKSSKLALDEANLTESSFLCLSSSESESEGEGEGTQTPRRNKGVLLRDSILTLKEGESAIYTPEAYATIPFIKARQTSIGRDRGSKLSEKSQSQTQDRSTLSNDKPSNIGSTGLTGRSNGVHKTESPLHLTVPPPAPSAAPNRRSRFIAVTRQEEQLLEMMRRNRGGLPPNFLIDGISSTNGPEAKLPSIEPPNSASHGSNMVSPSFQQYRAAYLSHAENDAAVDKGASSSHRVAPNGGEPSKEYSKPSSRTNPVNSDTLASQSSNQGLSRSSTLPTIRVSGRSANPTTTLAEQRHARTRTEGRGAVTLGGAGGAGGSGRDLKDEDGLPIWAFGWRYGAGGLTAVDR
jgi:hypothetical protein